MGSKKKRCKHQLQKPITEKEEEVANIDIDIDIDIHTGDWTGLPDDISFMIIERLNFTDRIIFSSVCKSWRRMAAEPFPCKQLHGVLPWLVMSGEHRKNTRTCFSIIDKNVWYIKMPRSYGEYIWGTFNDWLIMVKQIHSGKKLRISLLNPFSRSEILLPRVVADTYIKLLLSGSPCDQSCIYMLVSDRKFSLWFIGCQDWFEFELNSRKPVFDGVFCNGYFYLCAWEQFLVVDAVQASSSTLKREDIELEQYEVKLPGIPLNFYGSDLYTLRYMVESFGEILLVLQFSKLINLSDDDFKVYRLNFVKMEWEYLEDLGDRILFVGKNCCTSFSIKELEIDQMTSNCIYFTNGVKNHWYDWSMCKQDFHYKGSKLGDWGIFKLSCDGHGKFAYHEKEESWGPLWISAPIWWYFQRNNNNNILV